MGLKPKNIYEDSISYTLPHEIGFLIQELAAAEAEKLKLSKLSTSDYLERTVRKLAEENLSNEARQRAREKAEKRIEERRRRAQEREEKGAPL
jgi:hypothetical protein